MRRTVIGVLAVLIISGVVVAAYFALNQTQTVFLEFDRYKHTIVIDAGHGGVDGGTTSVSGILESGINLEIARKTDALLRFCGVNTVMVRTEDISIHDAEAETIAQKKKSDLNNRVKLVNRTPHALLLSIHQNSFTEPQYFGAQTFFNSKLDAAGLALLLQEQFIRLDPDNTRKSKPIADNIFLMNNVECPAVLVECGFLSNHRDDKNLTDEKYQSKVAMTLVSAYTLWDN